MSKEDVRNLFKSINDAREAKKIKYMINFKNPESVSSEFGTIIYSGDDNLIKTALETISINTKNIDWALQCYGHLIESQKQDYYFYLLDKLLEFKSYGLWRKNIPKKYLQKHHVQYIKSKINILIEQKEYYTIAEIINLNIFDIKTEEDFNDIIKILDSFNKNKKDYYHLIIDNEYFKENEKEYYKLLNYIISLQKDDGSYLFQLYKYRNKILTKYKLEKIVFDYMIKDQKVALECIQNFYLNDNNSRYAEAIYNSINSPEDSFFVLKNKIVSKNTKYNEVYDKLINKCLETPYYTAQLIHKNFIKKTNPNYNTYLDFCFTDVESIYFLLIRKKLNTRRDLFEKAIDMFSNDIGKLQEILEKSVIEKEDILYKPTFKKFESLIKKEDKHYFGY